MQVLVYICKKNVRSRQDEINSQWCHLKTLVPIPESVHWNGLDNVSEREFLKKNFMWVPYLITYLISTKLIYNQANKENMSISSYNIRFG